MNFFQSYIDELKEALDSLSGDVIEQVLDILHVARMDNQQVFILGNGGSASTASHFVCDLGKNTRVQGAPNFRVMSLTDNIALFSALANDEGYENVFTKQLGNYLQPDDVADAPVLASKVNGVLLIIQLGHTRAPAIKAMMEQINRSGAKVVGVALNRLPARSVGYYTGNPNYSSYYNDEVESWQGTDQQRSWRERLSFWPFNSQAKSRSGSGSRRVFDEIDIVEEESDAYGWRE